MRRGSSRPARRSSGPVGDGAALVGLLVTILLLGGLVAGSVLAAGSLSGSGAGGPAARSGAAARAPGSTGSTVAAAAAPGQASAAAAAAERAVLVTAEGTYQALHGCYTGTDGLVAAGILRQRPAYWTVTVSAQPCPAEYTLVPVGRPSGR